jgi:transposase
MEVDTLPSKPSGKVKIGNVRCTQKNGDIYILERQTIYDEEKKQTKILSSKLLSKIPKGSKTEVATRPKRTKEEKEADGYMIVASRNRVGMMQIIDHIGKISGIDEGIYRGTDLGTAQKILSIARFFMATDGHSLPLINTWQFSHQLPYEDGITEDIYGELFERVGRDESLQQNYFAARCEGISSKPVLAFDSTTQSTYSENQIDARYGYNKDGDGLKTIKLLTLYSIDTRQPVVFTKQPGNISDVTAITNTLIQLSALGVSDAEIVTDNGYYSESNVTEFFLSGFDFITLIKTSIKWVKAELDTHISDFGSMSSTCPYDTMTHGITVSIMREFKKVRKYNNHLTGARKGDEEVFTKRVYLHIYYNPFRKAENDAAFESDLIELKRLVEAGEEGNLSETALKKVDKYLLIRRRAGNVKITFNEEACAETKKYHGYFALVSNCEKEPFGCLLRYRKREYIELCFRNLKRRTDGEKPRVWSTDTLRGRLFTQFVALCYHEYLSEEIRKMKLTLGVSNGDPLHDTKKVLDLEKKLKYWLEESSIHTVLQWFDTVEGVNVSSKLANKRWTTEITQRDRLFLEKLGIGSVSG